MNIALLEPLGIPSSMLENLIAPFRAGGHAFTVYRDKAADSAELIRRCAGQEAVIIANRPLPAEVIAASPALRFIDVAFTGIDHIGLDACRAQGITVSNAANYSNDTVAELVIGMALSLLRFLPEAERAVRGGGTSAGLMGREISGKTVGIIGLGRIGLRTARLFRAFGAQVVYTSRTRKPDAEAEGMRFLPLGELMAESDIVSLHTPNTPETRGLISRELLLRMKPTALFINCARGPIVDNRALADVLNAGKIAGAAVDVFDMEPPLPEDYPLLHAQHTLLTPHVAFLSEEAMVRRADIVFDNLRAWLNGKPVNVCL